MVIGFHCLNFQEDSVHFHLYSPILRILYKILNYAFFSIVRIRSWRAVLRKKENKIFIRLWCPSFHWLNKRRKIFLVLKRKFQLNYIKIEDFKVVSSQWIKLHNPVTDFWAQDCKLTVWNFKNNIKLSYFLKKKNLPECKR